MYSYTQNKSRQKLGDKIQKQAGFVQAPVFIPNALMVCDGLSLLLHKTLTGKSATMKNGG
ncbi:MAG: hypothetical protein ACNYPD_05030 [Candidatus Halichondribacter symbioticus]